MCPIYVEGCEISQAANVRSQIYIVFLPERGIHNQVIKLYCNRLMSIHSTCLKCDLHRVNTFYDTSLEVNWSSFTFLGYLWTVWSPNFVPLVEPVWFSSSASTHEIGTVLVALVTNNQVVLPQYITSTKFQKLHFPRFSLDYQFYEFNLNWASAISI